MDWYEYVRLMIKSDIRLKQVFLQGPWNQNYKYKNILKYIYDNKVPNTCLLSAVNVRAEIFLTLVNAISRGSFSGTLHSKLVVLLSVRHLLGKFICSVGDQDHFFAQMLTTCQTEAKSVQRVPL